MIQSLNFTVTPGYNFPPGTAYGPDDFRAAATPSVAATLDRTPVEIAGTEISWSSGKVFYKTLTANTTFTFAGATAGEHNVIEVVLASGAGGFTAAFPASVKWAGGSDPTMTATAARWDIFRFRLVDGNYLGEVVAQNLS